MPKYMVNAEDKIYLMEGDTENFKATKVVRNISRKKISQTQTKPPPKEIKHIPFIPLEVSEMILTELFLIYAKELDFKRMVQLATSFSKSYTKLFCRSVFGYLVLGEEFSATYWENTFLSIELLSIRRISRTFRLLSMIYNSYLLKPSTPHYRNYKQILRFQNTARTEPWDFFLDHDSFKVDQERIDSGIEPILETLSMDIQREWFAYQCGPCLGDSVWLEGDYERSVLLARDVLSPVLILDLQVTKRNSSEQYQIYKKRDDKPSTGWQAFNKLFGLIFGPTAGVFYVQIPDLHIFNGQVDDHFHLFTYIDKYD